MSLSVFDILENLVQHFKMFLSTQRNQLDGLQTSKHFLERMWLVSLREQPVVQECAKCLAAGVCGVRVCTLK